MVSPSPGSTPGQASDAALLVTMGHGWAGDGFSSGLRQEHPSAPGLCYRT